MFTECGMGWPTNLTEPLAPRQSRRNNDASDVTVAGGTWGGRGTCGGSGGGGAPDAGGRGPAPGPGGGGVRGGAGGLEAAAANPGPEKGADEPASAWPRSPGRR